MITFKRQILLTCTFLLQSLRNKSKKKKKSYVLLAQEIIQTSQNLVNL